MIKYLKKVSDFENIKGRCLIDFYAEWCGPCKMMGALLEDMGEDLKVPVIKINTDNFPELATKMGIMSIPTLVIMENGKEIKRNIGFLPEDELKKFID